MLKFLKNMANKTRTENGAVTHKSTESHCLDLFATIGALRDNAPEEIVKRFLRAFAENPELALRTAFYARDVRGGLGERRVFRIILNYLANNNPEILAKNIELIPEFGRFDDLIALLGTPCESDAINLIKKQLTLDLHNLKNGQPVSLLAKWLPSVNTSNAETRANGKKIARSLGINEQAYRKMLVSMRKQIKIIENNLREKDYTFDYSAQPSAAMLKYQKAFLRNDGIRYKDFLTRVNHGEAKLNTTTLTPFDLVRKVLTIEITPEHKKALNTTWENLKDFANNSNTLMIIDTSGSMTEPNFTPISVAISLGLYFAERNTGMFSNHFIEFSDHPELIKIKGDNFVDRAQYVFSFNELAGTNLEAVFDLILSTAVKHKVPQKDLPERMIIVSDMEFNECVIGADLTNFESAKRKFEAFGYKLPEVVFWNVNSRQTNQPVTQNEQGVALVSGYTPAIFEMVAEGFADPYDFMIKILNSERYKKITV